LGVINFEDVEITVYECRACFKKLPHILCFNTMRYTFNMLTMLKEKVNTHFSFPLRLDMSGYVEKHLMPQHYQGNLRVF
jgi:ubiquitin carboxyl-terminal hydrolase 34